ncbi:BRCA1-associated protein [Dichanthelium oligosanthes]|uniref:BRCA1-associated protein n=1 Tax=Dichanthelium oligosanthes TaxID=888268 RepID=A0A1E5UKW3_9POAL|nr:BRCA1-associated protein [Dichanthelium oligosanthes]
MATAGKPAASLPPPAAPSTSSHALDSVHFSSGNPRIEETRGVVLLHPDPSTAAASSSHLPVGRKPRVCVLAVPNHMTYADFCRFCGAFVPHTLEMRIVRTDDAEDQYSVLINFNTQNSTDNFYKHFNGKQFSSLEVLNCFDSSEFERLDQDPGGILTTICNHSFHCSCISKWTDSSCPVCRYCQQQPEKSMCSICGTSENLWICVICGHVGCGRYKGGHAIEHWKETEHCYSLELETQKVWDYAGDNYVHRLIQSKTDGKLVEYNCHGGHIAENTCSLCSGDSAMSEALLNSKFETIVEEYNDLVTSQLEKQRNFNDNLVKDQEKWIETIRKAQAREQAALRLKDEKIEKLEEEIRDLIAHFECQNAIAQAPDLISSDIQGGTILPVSSSPSSSNSSRSSPVRGTMNGKLK